MVSPNEKSSSDRLPPETPPDSPTEAFGYVFQQLAEARDYFAYYARTRAEIFRLTVRNFLFIGVLTVTAVLLAGAVVVTAVVLVTRGVAEALTMLFGGRVWLGDLVTGILLLVFVVAAIYGAITTIAKSWKRRTFSSYAEQKRRERAQESMP